MCHSPEGEVRVSNQANEQVDMWKESEKLGETQTQNLHNVTQLQHLLALMYITTLLLIYVK